MEKKITIKNDGLIGQTISQLNQLAQQLEDGLNLLDRYNEINYIIDKKYIYELVTITNGNSLQTLKGVLKNQNILENDESNLKLSNLKKILFTQKGYNIKNYGYPEQFDELPSLKEAYICLYNCGELENKNSFNFDLINNVVTIKEEIINYINEKFSIDITSKNKIKAYEIMKNINSEIDELKKNYNVNGDAVTNDIYRDIYQCYTNHNIGVQKVINYDSVYQNIISKIKD